MKLSNGETITKTDPYRHKFNNAMAEYLWHIMLNGDNGDTEAVGPDCSAQAYGKYVLYCDSVGFVYSTKYDSAETASRLVDQQQLLWDSTE